MEFSGFGKSLDTNKLAPNPR